METHTLTIQEQELVTGGTFAHLAVAAALLEAGYEFYQGYTANRD